MPHNYMRWATTHAMKASQSLSQNTEIQRIFEKLQPNASGLCKFSHTPKNSRTSTTSQDNRLKKKRARIGPVSSKWREEYVEHDINIFLFGESVQSLIESASTSPTDLRPSVAYSTTYRSARRVSRPHSNRAISTAITQPGPAQHEKRHRHCQKRHTACHW